MSNRAMSTRCLFVLTALAAAVAAQTRTPAPAPAPAPAHAPAPPPAAGEQVAEWPQLKDTEKAKVLALADQFRKDAKLHADAKNQLIKIGTGGLPLLMQQVRDREDPSNTPLFEVFDVLIQPQHATLIAAEAGKPKVELRRYLTLRLCRFHSPAATKLFESLRTDKDELTAFYSQLGLLGLEQKDALMPVLQYSKMHWKDVGQLCAEVLTPIRSAKCGEWVFEAIAKAEAADQMAGLRLARHLMVKEQRMILRTYLNASDHTVKREAVNTARVLHGEQPQENLTVFQSIEQAKQWLAKL